MRCSKVKISVRLLRRQWKSVDGWNNAAFRCVRSGQKDTLPYIVSVGWVCEAIPSTLIILHSYRLTASWTAAVALITRTYGIVTELQWPDYTSFSSENNLNIGNLSSAVSRNLIEFVGIDRVLLQNAVAEGHQTVTAASSPTFPWETVRVWIVFKGQAALIFSPLF